MLKRLLRTFGKNFAMDLGTANSLLYVQGAGLIINEPSVVAVDTLHNTVMAVGAQAKQFLGRTPQRIKVVRPMKDGVIADFDITKEMIAHFIRKAITGFRLMKPRIAICIPTGITQVEKRAVIDAAMLAGVREVLLIEEPMAAAIGAHLPVHEAIGNFVIDIGGGTSEVAVITMSAIAYAESVRVAGDAMDRAIQRYMRDVFHLMIGETTAENIKILIGSAVPVPHIPLLEVSGKDVMSGIPKTVRVTEGHIREALRECVRTILGAVLNALEKTPPELASDIFRNGILLAGGGALLKGLDTYIARETRLKVIVDNDPLTTILRGTAKTIDEPDYYEQVYIN